MPHYDQPAAFTPLLRLDALLGTHFVGRFTEPDGPWHRAASTRASRRA
ncbi:DUF6000 family protein [Streptomyces sp. cg36]